MKKLSGVPSVKSDFISNCIFGFFTFNFESAFKIVLFS